LTLVELMVGAMMLAVAISSLLWALTGQMGSNELSRSRAWALNDASRIMEHLRLLNSSGCANPSANPPGGFASWDAWLADTGATGGGGKSVQPDPATNELVVVSSQGGLPLEVTVAICWRHRTRVIGECSWNGAALVADPAAGGDPVVTESPAMLATLVTCR
jgi:type II secretory pathway pseudopilin PulG